MWARPSFGAVSMGARLGPNAFGGITWRTIMTGDPEPRGVLDIKVPGGGSSSASLTDMVWHGCMSLAVTPGLGSGYILIDNVSDATNYERASHRWTSNVYAIGTENGGTGTLQDFVLKTGDNRAVAVLQWAAGQVFGQQRFFRQRCSRHSARQCWPYWSGDDRAEVANH